MRGADLLSSYDAGALSARLEGAGASATSARAASSRAIVHAFRSRGEWSDEALARADVGAWARPSLLALDASPSLVVADEAPAGDGARRLLLKARDGALIEAVLIPSFGPGATSDAPRRTTLCISSQVGCARACTFCETGRLGLARQLSAGEIVDQVRLARAASVHPIGNLVFMGMGEPFDNLDEVLRAIRLLTDARAFAFAPSRVTVSTVGVADKIAAFFEATRAELAVSLNAPDDARRSSIMPINERYDLDRLKRSIALALPPKRRVFFEYVLFDGFNDALDDADLLARFVAGIRCRVNVIPCNPGPDPKLRPPSIAALDAFVARLSSHSVTTLVRRPRGRDVGGACGQLAGARRLDVIAT